VVFTGVTSSATNEHNTNLHTRSGLLPIHVQPVEWLKMYNYYSLLNKKYNKTTVHNKNGYHILAYAAATATVCLQ